MTGLQQFFNPVFGRWSVSTKELEWSVEVFDQSQSLKSKVNAIKGSNTKIQTGAWKDGVYIVRAKIGKKIISEKLVVKH